MDAGLTVQSERMTTPVVRSKLLSFMAAGFPVVASVLHESDPRTLVLRARCGLWTPAGDPGALAAGCADFLSDRVAALAAGLPGQAYARELSTLERVSRMVAELLDEMTSP